MSIRLKYWRITEKGFQKPGKKDSEPRSQSNLERNGIILGRMRPREMQVSLNYLG